MNIQGGLEILRGGTRLENAVALRHYIIESKGAGQALSVVRDSTSELASDSVGTIQQAREVVAKAGEAAGSRSLGWGSQLILIDVAEPSLLFEGSGFRSLRTVAERGRRSSVTVVIAVTDLDDDPETFKRRPTRVISA